MTDAHISRGFSGRRRERADSSRIPPGQYLTRDFPVLSAGPTPHTPLDQWAFTVDGAVDRVRTWTWTEFLDLPQETPTVDIHCVTKWSKLHTSWRGVSVDALLEDVTEGRAWIVHEYDGEPLDPEHGGPARLLVPHLYFWKSAKWVRGLALTPVDEPGFWETYGYHNHGDPWLEQRYHGD